MINQLYIQSEDSYLVCIVKSMCSIETANGVVILLPGFSQSACDIDYFMSDLSNELNVAGYITIQVDLYGHGDSYGDLAELNIETVKRNITSICDYARREWKEKLLFGISRGLYGNILCDKSVSSGFTKIICINPVYLQGDFSVHIPYKKNIFLEITDIVKKNKMLENLFELMGAEESNVKGQQICTSLLYEIVGVANKQKSPENAIVISTYNDTAKIEIGYELINKEQGIEYLSKRCFLREPEWQNNLIETVAELINRYSYENSVVK